MARAKKADGEVRRIRPALTPEAREQQLISLATNLVEQRLLNGTASSQETTHFLKLGSTKHKLEMEKLRVENELTIAKKQALESQKRQEELFEEAIKAMRRYSGKEDEDEEYDDEPEY